MSALTNRDVAIMPASTPSESNFHGLEDLWKLALVESGSSSSLLNVPGATGFTAAKHGTVVGYSPYGEIKVVVVQETSTMVIAFDDASSKQHVQPAIIEHRRNEGASNATRQTIFLRGQSAPEKYRALKRYFLERHKSSGRARTDSPVPVTAVTNQQELPLASDYSPSHRVLSIWVQSLNLIASEASDDSSYSLQAYRLTEDKFLLQREFSDRFLGALATYAMLKSYSLLAIKLSIGGKFLYSFESHIFSAFLIAPTQASLFFEALFEDLRKWLSVGRKIEGAWGELLVDGTGDFTLKLLKRRKKKTPGFNPVEFT